MNSIPNDALAFEAVDYDPFGTGAVERVVPTTEAQREVWLADKLSPQASLAFNESVGLTLHGTLDAAALRNALTALVARHEALRSTVGPDGGEWRIGAAPAFDAALFDLRELDVGERRHRLARALAQAVETPFDLERGPLLRAAVYRLADDEHLLLLTAHHIACDGWSWGVIAADLGALYTEQVGAGPGLDPAPRYSDYVAWEAAEAASPQRAEHERYWLERYPGSRLPVLELPTDRPRAPVRGFRSRRIDHGLDAELVAALRRLGARSGASLFATLFSGFAALLQRLSGQDDVVIGVPAAGQAASGMSGLVGHCVNLLPLRTAVAADEPYEALLQRCSHLVLDAFEHQTVTYGSLLKKLPVQRDPSRLPLVSVMFNLDQAIRGDADGFAGLRFEFAGTPRHYENFELFVNAAQVDGGLRLECQYNTELFDAATVRRWLALYEGLLRAALADAGTAVGALDWLPAGERAALAALQPPATPLPQPALMHAAFERQAAAAPQRAALRCGDERLDYGTLARRAEALAALLRTRGIGRGERVGLCLPRGPEMVVALLAVLKSGAAYVPLDPGFPAARLAYYAEDARLALLITAGALPNAPQAWRPDAAERILRLDTPGAADAPASPGVPPAIDPEDPAYVIYTSGSTGQPKGVVVPHRAVANFLASMAREPGLAPDDRLAAVTTLSFDIAVLELLLPLSVGAETLIVPRETALDGNALRALLQASGASAMQATPGLWRMLLDTDWRSPAGFKALVGGESVPVDLARELLARCGSVWNVYGPTETTVWSTVWPVQREALDAGGMSIGRPIANTSVWVLDALGAPCPLGVPGELCVGGAGLALGYHERDALNADRFITATSLPGGPQRLYRTGDRGRWRNDGLLEHLGRLDFQVKVRGYRIELGEVEAACLRHAGVADGVVAARPDHRGDASLVAYLCPAAGATLDTEALRAHLRALLPEYMLPQQFVTLAQLPRLPNGKVDRQALPAVQPEAATPRGERVAPRNALQAQLLAAMEALLQLPGLGIRDDFFALGGHSLLAARLTSRLNRELELELPLRTLFEAPTVEQLAAAVERARADGAQRSAPLLRRAQRERAPLTPMQERVRFVEALHPGRTVYNTPSGHRLRGPMDLARFEQALREIVRRQPALRTCIVPRTDGGGHEQRIIDELAFELPLVDLRGIPAERREAELLQRMQAVVDTPLDTSRAPLFRAVLYRLADDEHAFLFMPHHLVWDGWSFDLLYEELAAIYGALVDGRTPALPPLAVDYGDFAEWYARWLDGPECARQLAYWKRRFADSASPRAPQTDHPRRAGMSGEGAAQWVRVERALTERLREVARHAGVTLNMLTLGVYAALMAAFADSPAVVVGVPVRGRMRAELEPVMGFFNNLLPVQIAVPREAPLGQHLATLKQDLLEAFGHQDVPFERLALEPELAARRAGPYQALFSFQDARDRTRLWGGLRQSSILLLQKGATEDLGLWLMEVPGGLEGGMTYNAALYDAATVTALRERYLAMLAQVADTPGLTLGALCGAPIPRAATAAPAASAVRRAPPEPLDADEARIAGIWASMLELDAAQVGPEDRFFDLGGNSLMAMWMAAQLEKLLGRKLPPSLLAADPSLRELAQQLRQDAADSLLLLRAGEGGVPLFLVHDGDGEILLYRNLAQRLDARHPVYGLRPQSGAGAAMLHTRVEAMAAHHVARMRAVQPRGPYLVGGLCAGGIIAWEIASQLETAGERVALLALLDAPDVAATDKPGRVARGRLRSFAEGLANKDALSAPKLLQQQLSKVYNLLSYEASSRVDAVVVGRRFRALRAALDAGEAPPETAQELSVREIYNAALDDYVPERRLERPILLVRARPGAGLGADEASADRYADPVFGWGARTTVGVHAVDVDGGHFSMLQEPHVAGLAQRLQAEIDTSLPQAGGLAFPCIERSRSD